MLSEYIEASLMRAAIEDDELIFVFVPEFSTRRLLGKTVEEALLGLASSCISG